MFKLSKKSLLLVAVILSAIFAGLLYRYLSTPVDAETVIVAKTDISPKTVITAEMIKEASVPKEYIQPNAIQDKKKIVGSIAREAIISGEQITSKRLFVAGKTAGFTGIIPSDKRAMTVSVNDETGVAGFTKPGDYVDVIVTLEGKELGEPISQTILQNLLVLAFNRDVEAGDGASSDAKKGQAAANTAKSNTVTLAVSPMEAVKLAMGDEKGKIRLVLRPFMPLDGGAILTSVTPTSLIGGRVAQQPAPTYSNQAAEEVNYSSREYVPQESPKAVSKTIQVIRGTKTETISVE